MGSSNKKTTHFQNILNYLLKGKIGKVLIWEDWKNSHRGKLEKNSHMGKLEKFSHMEKLGKFPYAKIGEKNLIWVDLKNLIRENLKISHMIHYHGST